MSDALASLRTALAPKAGLHRIPFPLESYVHPSLPLSAKRVLNLMAEKAPDDARAPAVLVSTPGAIWRETMGSGPVLAFSPESLIGGFYAVSGDRAFRNSAGVTVDLGFVGTASDIQLNPHQIGATIAGSQTTAVICVPPRAYVCEHDGPLHEIGGDFPGATSVCFIDNYFVFTQVGWGTRFFISEISDPTAYDALDFANLEGHTNIIFRAIVQRNELWLGGFSGWEVWYNSGDADFPFRRRAGGVIPYGLATPNAVAQIDGSVFWLGNEGSVYRSQGYQALRVSSHAVEAVLGSASPEQATATAYQQEGHALYCVTSGNRTLCYDCATQLWHDRSSSADGSGPWLARVAGRIGEGQYIADAAGRLYSLQLTAGTDNGTVLPRQIITPPLWADGARAFCHRIEVEMEAGTLASHGPVTLEWSDDGGTTWSAPRALSAGAVGARRTRVAATRLGSFRQRVFRITATGTPALYAIDADIAGGAW